MCALALLRDRSRRRKHAVRGHTETALAYLSILETLCGKQPDLYVLWTPCIYLAGVPEVRETGVNKSTPEFWGHLLLPPCLSDISAGGRGYYFVSPFPVETGGHTGIPRLWTP